MNNNNEQTEPQKIMYTPVFLSPEILDNAEELNKIENEQPLRIVGHNLAICAVMLSKSADAIMMLENMMSELNKTYQMMLENAQRTASARIYTPK